MLIHIHCENIIKYIFHESLIKVFPNTKPIPSFKGGDFIRTISGPLPEKHINKTVQIYIRGHLQKFLITSV